MKVHLNQIPVDGLHLEGEEECPIADLAADNVICVEPMHYSLDVGTSEGALWASGLISQKVEVECVACLRRFVHDIRVEDFAIHTDLSGPELVDLTPFAREDLLLNLPPYPRCDRHGGLICEASGAKVDSDTERTVAKAKREAAWGALDNLDLPGR